MTAPTFSPVRVVLVVLLACVTMWYLGSLNVVPRGSDRRRQEHSLYTPTSFRVSHTAATNGRP